MSKLDSIVPFENQEVAEVEEEKTYCDEIITQPFSPSDIRLENPPMNLGDLIDMINEGWIKFDPDYQREQNLWNETQQSRLIESVLLGLRLPAFYFEEVSKRQWNIIDGLQRCCAIRNFCVDNTLQLTGLEFLSEVFNGKKFLEMDFATRRDIRMLPITVNLLNAGVDDMVKYILFKRLNTGGVPLTNQEIRNAIFSGKAIDAVKEMSKCPEFIEATGGKIETLRKTDMDFVSRFVAFYVQGWENYQPDLDNFINEAMIILRDKWSDKEITDMIFRFQEAMHLSYELFGNRAFRRQRSRNDRRTPLNKAYFEVISVSFAKLDKLNRDRILQKRELLLDNMYCAMNSSRSYCNSHSGGTADRSAVRTRFSWMEQILEHSLNNKKIRINDNKIEVD
ncbi:MAG: DUF262 domain-containing protein [Bacteroidales bacterium]|nr:DUF262 domain-containing protein [Bacteroidales bacterium]